MSKKFMYIIITKMHCRLNTLIEKNNFNLMAEEVQEYSRRLDRVLAYYNKVKKKNGKHINTSVQLTKMVV